jgi:Axonemal dynein light chain
MKLSIKNHKSHSSNPTLHSKKASQDTGLYELINPNTSKGARILNTQGRLRIDVATPTTPRYTLLSTLGLQTDRRTPKLPKDLNSLDKYVAGNYDRIPPDRDDAKALLKWLDDMLQQILVEQIDPEKIFENAYRVYNVCLSEIVKQVSVQCYERGALIERIWKAYQTLFEKAKKVQSIKFSLIEEQNSAEKNKIHKLYNTQIKDLENDLETLTKKYKSTLEAFEENKSLCEVYKTQEEKLKKKIETIQFRYKHIKREILVTKEEIRVIKASIKNNTLNHDGQTSSLAKLHQRARLKVKTSKDIEKELESDPVLAQISKLVDYDQNNFLEQIKNYGKL